MPIRKIYDAIVKQAQRGSQIDADTWLAVALGLELVSQRVATHSEFWALNSMALTCRERADYVQRGLEIPDVEVQSDD